MIGCCNPVEHINDYHFYEVNLSEPIAKAPFETVTAIQKEYNKKINPKFRIIAEWILESKIYLE